MAFPLEPLASEILAYNAEELDRHVKDFGYICARDPENLPWDWDGTPRDRRLDPSELTARLEAIGSPVATARRSPASSSSDSDSTLPPLTPRAALEKTLRYEKDAYKALIDGGACPPFPFHLLEDFFYDSSKYLDDPQYADVVSYCRWAKSGEVTPCCSILNFGWFEFRERQRGQRETFAKFRSTLSSDGDHRLSEESVNRSGFLYYVQWLKKRLAKYDFTQPFELERDHTRQDELTTWIEYFGHECWSHELATRQLDALQSSQNKPHAVRISGIYISEAEAQDRQNRDIEKKVDEVHARRCLLRWVEQQVSSIAAGSKQVDNIEHEPDPTIDLRLRKRPHSHVDESNNHEDPDASIEQSFSTDGQATKRRKHSKRVPSGGNSDLIPPRSAHMQPGETDQRAPIAGTSVKSPLSPQHARGKDNVGAAAQTSCHISSPARSPLRRSARIAEKNAKVPAATHADNVPATRSTRRIHAKPLAHTKNRSTVVRTQAKGKRKGSRG